MIILFILLAAVFLLFGFYLTTGFHKFTFVRNIEAKNKLLSWVVSAIPIFLFAVAAIFKPLLSVIAAIHLALFFLLCDLLHRVLSKLLRRSFCFNWFGMLALVLTAAYIGCGAWNAQHVQRTSYPITTSKFSASESSLRIAQISDSHIGTTFSGRKLRVYLEKIAEDHPDLLVITGDFTDESTSYRDMTDACAALGDTDFRYGVYFVFGNHDRNTYREHPQYTEQQLLAELEKNRVRVLRDETILVGDRFYLCGRRDASEQSRKSAAELLADADPSKFIVLLDHQPLEYDDVQKAGADLVLSGHTHGGQLFPLNLINSKISPNEMVYGHRSSGGTDYIVSSGISEWGFPLRTGSVTEYVLIEIGGMDL